MNLMLDTNVFNDVVDGHIVVEAFGSHSLYATYVQRHEISATPDQARRHKLERAFALLEPKSLHPIAVPGLAIPGEVVPGDDGSYGALLVALDKLDRRRSNPKDALIAEVAKRHGLTLVTRDGPLCRAASDFGITCVNLAEVVGAPLA